jgi:hypothetical protein
MGGVSVYIIFDSDSLDDLSLKMANNGANPGQTGQHGMANYHWSLPLKPSSFLLL